MKSTFTVVTLKKALHDYYACENPYHLRVLKINCSVLLIVIIFVNSNSNILLKRWFDKKSIISLTMLCCLT